MSEPQQTTLRVLIANELGERLTVLTAIVEALGHEIVGRSVNVEDVGPLSRSTDADIAWSGSDSTARTRST